MARESSKESGFIFASTEDRRIIKELMREVEEHNGSAPIEDAPTQQCGDVWEGDRCVKKVGHNGMHLCDGKQWASDEELAAPESAEPRIQDDLCDVCCGQPLASGRACICGGSGCGYDEKIGLRKECDRLAQLVERLEGELSAAKAAHGKTLQLSCKMAFETIPKASEWIAVDQELPPLASDIVVYPYSPADNAGLQHMRRAYEQRCGELTAALATNKRLEDELATRSSELGRYMMALNTVNERAAKAESANSQTVKLLRDLMKHRGVFLHDAECFSMDGSKPCVCGRDELHKRISVFIEAAEVAAIHRRGGDIKDTAVRQLKEEK